MSSNTNLGYTGYLLRKTVQPHSLRYDNSNFNEYRSKNMIMYINKKVSNTREREGKNLSHQQLQKGINIMVRKANGQASGAQKDNEESSQVQEEVNLEQLKKDEEKERQDPFYQEVMIRMKQNEYTDDFAVVSEENKILKQAKGRKERSDIEQTLNILVANNLDQNNLQELFRDFKKISLKDKLNDLKSRHADMAKIQRKIKKDQQTMQGLEDNEKVNKFMNIICQSRNLTLGKILSMKEEEIQYGTQDDGLESIPKVKALEMLQELIEDEEEENQKNMIKIFKKTQLDNIDIDAARNKFNMTSFKKKNEQTEKLYNQMAENNKKAILNASKIGLFIYFFTLLSQICLFLLLIIYLVKDPQFDPEKFVRNKESVKPPSEKVNVFQRLISPEYAKMQEEIQRSMPRQIPLHFVQTEQEKCHQKLKELFSQNKTHESAPNIFDSRISTKKSFNLNTQQSQNGQQFFLTQSNYSVPNSTLHRSHSQKVQFKNLTANSALFTPQKNPIELSQISTDVKSGTDTQTKQISRNLSAKFTPFNSSVEAYQIKTPKSQSGLQNTQQQQYYQQQQKRNQLLQRQSKSMSSNPYQDRKAQIKVQSQAEILQQRINKLRENKQFAKANKLQMLLNKIEMQKEVQNFVETCNQEKLEAAKQSSFTNHKINNLENEFENDLKEINLLQQGQVNVEVKIDNPNFIEFKNRSEFKRKLINHLIKKVDKKTDLLSKYKQKQFTQNFLQKLQDDGYITVDQ
ncbi:transmembrane protein, putative (macronuclear) [Tetrahymena thermophila SB210]|uniref:Transmembrane protein, putative n=1 Tax=Tetrahymena thermophila (strain SB210) TaxID=312017 RepID=Q239N0_TETTS|nr:transmembrane protein, putative [Tetrahymena thermophila SB210]EAR93240.2 transmembrane protein, putative [Tetrahymena thermophila SB210]|eukprot:XP_001013485.2 transmembrane protein, putative [Tetrahymena thermophila SB210]